MVAKSPVERWSIPWFIGLQPSFWWCRISLAHPLMLARTSSIPASNGEQKPLSIPRGSMYGIYANIWGILMVNVIISSIYGSFGIDNLLGWTPSSHHGNPPIASHSCRFLVYPCVKQPWLLMSCSCALLLSCFLHHDKNMLDASISNPFNKLKLILFNHV